MLETPVEPGATRKSKNASGADNQQGRLEKESKGEVQNNFALLSSVRGYIYGL